MQTLASLFVGLVALINAAFPQANIPAVLGVNVENQDAVSQLKEFYESRMDKNATESAEIKKDSIQRAKEERQLKIDQFFRRQEGVQQDIREYRGDFGESLNGVAVSVDKEVLERIAVNLNAVNQRWVQRWMNVLSRLSAILAKVESRNKKLQAEGADVSSTNEAIETTKIAIDEAQDKLDEQVMKIYKIDLNENENLQGNTDEAVKDLNRDLADTKQSILDAKDAVTEAISHVRKVYDDGHSK